MRELLTIGYVCVAGVGVLVSAAELLNAVGVPEWGLVVFTLAATPLMFAAIVRLLDVIA